MERNPYVGPRAFKAGEKLYGRDQEALDLLDLLIAERIVLLHSPSGAGKTSLLQAALIPELKDEEFEVFPIMRVSSEPTPNEKAGITIENRYSLSAMLMMEKGLPSAERKPLAELAQQQFSDYLALRLNAIDPQRNVVLIFDQFEEFITVDPSDRPKKDAFLHQLGDFLRNPRCWALFSMREDYLAELDPYLRHVPTRLSNTFRLDLLSDEAALDAIQNPSKQQGVIFEDDAAQKLVNDLRTIRIQRPDGTTEERLGQYVEPVHLQVVCSGLWDKLPKNTQTIAIADIKGSGDVNDALVGYYAAQVEKIAVEQKVSEREIRGWFNNALITEQGIRGQVLHTPNRSQGLDNRAIWPLIDAHLVRAEKRRGATWFELAHDRLIKPVQSNNAAWLERNLEPFQRQAELWDRQKRPEGLLLHDVALVEAEAWALANEEKLTPLENDFLFKSQQARTKEQQDKESLRKQAEHDRRQATRFRWLALVTTVISVISILILVWALTTNRTLAFTRDQLNTVLGDLQIKNSTLDKQKGDLETTNAKLTETSNALTTTNLKLEGTNKDLAGAITKLNSTLGQLKRKNDELTVQFELDEKNRLAIQDYQRGEMGIAAKMFGITRSLYKDAGNQGGEGWALANIGLSLRGMGKFDEATEAYEVALKLLAGAYSSDSSQMLFALDGLAQLEEEEGDQSKSDVHYAKAQSLYEKALKIRASMNTQVNVGLANNLKRLGTIYRKRDAYDDAITAYLGALRARREFSTVNLEDADIYGQLAFTYRQAGLTSGSKDSFAAAETNYKKALEIRERLLAPEHEDIAANLGALATLYGEMDKGNQGSDNGLIYFSLSEALNKLVRAIRDVPPGRDTIDKADKLFAVADLYRKAERLKEERNVAFNYDYAMKIYDRAIAMYKGLPNVKPLYLARRVDDVARQYASLSAYPNAKVEYYEKATNYLNEVLVQLRKDASDQTEDSLLDLLEELDDVAFLHETHNRFDRAEPLRKEALQLSENGFGAESGYGVYYRGQLANLYRETSRYGEAEPLYQRVIAWWAKSFGPAMRTKISNDLALPAGEARDNALSIMAMEPNEYAGALYELASIYVNQNKIAEAESLYKEGVAFVEWYGTVFAENNGKTWPKLSNRYALHYEFAEGTQHCLHAEYYDALADMNEAYATLLRASGKQRASEAEELEKRAKSFRLSAQGLQKLSVCH